MEQKNGIAAGYSFTGNSGSSSYSFHISFFSVSSIKLTLFLHKHTLMSSTSFLSLPDDCRLAIILAATSHSAASYSAADRLTLRCFLLLCKDFCKLALANWAQIVEHYTKKEALLNRIRYMFCGRLHRDNDLLAVIWADGIQEWWQHDKRHRDNDLPAVVDTNAREWWQHGKLHRDNDLPAVIWANGKQEWYQHNKRHRDNDLPAVIWANGKQEWYQHNKRHRDNDLPAIVYADGSKEWWRHNKLIHF